MKHTDVQLAFYEGGPEAVTRALDERLASPFTVKRAMKQLKAADRLTDELVEAVEAYGIALDPRPSKRAPGAGDERNYKQQKAKGQKFIRLNTEWLDIPDGGEVTVRFFLGSAKVEAADEQPG